MALLAAPSAAPGSAEALSSIPGKQSGKPGPAERFHQPRVSFSPGEALSTSGETDLRLLATELGFGGHATNPKWDKVTAAPGRGGSASIRSQGGDPSAGRVFLHPRLQDTERSLHEQAARATSPEAALWLRCSSISCFLIFVYLGGGCTSKTHPKTPQVLNLHVVQRKEVAQGRCRCRFKGYDAHSRCCWAAVVMPR